ncbi:hypothetical protein V8E53_004737 [Lactarius tabidus]
MIGSSKTLLHRVPGFFESDFPKKDTSASVLLSLMQDRPSQPDQFDPILGSCINDLLKTCVPGTSPLTEQLRKNRLRVCMRTLWYFAREYNRPGNTAPLPSYVRAIFANAETTHWIQSEEDLAARLIGRCFHSLIVKKVARDIWSHTAQGHLPSVAELSCPAAILSKTSWELATLLSQPGAIELANIVSLTSSEMETLAEGKVPSEVQNIFRTTLDMLLAEDLLAIPNAELPPDLSALFHETYSNARRLRAPEWLIDGLRQISEWLSLVLDKPEAPRLALPEPEPGSSSDTSDMSLRPRDDSASPLLGN